MSSVSASVRHPEDEAPMDVKMFIPYDSAKLCITQVCRYHSFMDYCEICIVFMLYLWIDLSIECDLSQNFLVQECIIFVIQEFWFASCTSHMSVTPLLSWGHRVGVRRLIWCHVLIFQGPFMTTHSWTTKNPEFLLVLKKTNLNRFQYTHWVIFVFRLPNAELLALKKVLI